MVHSPNFQFLASHDALLLDLAAQAERTCFSDPTVSLFRVRQLTESMALGVVSALGGFPATTVTRDFAAAVKLLEERNVLSLELVQIFRQLRQTGNLAVHENVGNRGDALHCLRLAQKVAVWFHRTLGNPTFKAPPFLPPPEPAQATAALVDELRMLREKLLATESSAQSAAQSAAEQSRLRAEAEEKARRAYADLETALDLAGEVETRLNASSVRFEATLVATPAPSPAAVNVTVEQAQHATIALSDELDESETRLLIDAQLRAAGWEADSTALRYGLGTRPEPGRYRAIAEWPTASGPVDYALFHGRTLIGIIEAKRQATDVPGVLEQAKRYSRDFRLHDAGQYHPGAPWGDHHAPFLFATNGRPYLRQLRTRSGVWMLDVRLASNLPDAVPGFYTPAGLLAALEAKPALSDAELARAPVDLPGLRDYQREAISAIEHHIALGQRDLLVAMATGTGKTRTCISLLYRLVRAKRFRRILFLVDRTELGTQAGDAFRDVKLENLQSFAQIYDVKEIGQARPDDDTRVHISTVQGMVKRLLYPSDKETPFPVDTYDCIVIDECHRGYVLDRDLSDDEIGFLDEQDFISKYRRVLDHFHAVRIGLTATPALHTHDIFGAPVFTYSYRQAVVDGNLCDHEPPLRIVTALAEDGIHWAAGDELALFDPHRGDIQLTTTPDEVAIEVDGFNSQVITENFNRTVCVELARHLDPGAPGKTLIFCVNDAHADLVVTLLSTALADRYGQLHQDTVAKITGRSDRPSQLVRRYKNEELPKIAVTVDLLTTGIDVPAILNLVFLRRVKSRLLYEQMLGRATRLCSNLYGPDADKDVFRIYDAVDLYATLRDFTNILPISANPQHSLEDLTQALLSPKATAATRQYFHDAILARLQRKRSLLARHDEPLAYRSGFRAAALLNHLRAGGPDASATLFSAKPGLAAYLDSLRTTGSRAVIPVSDHPDALRRTEAGYGPNGQKPADYLEGFSAWIRDNLAKLPALIVVTQRPRELTRAQLRELALALDEAGFSEIYLRTAWRDARQEDIAAGIVGYIRSQALGSPLVPYAERVDRAHRAILRRRYNWTAPQRKWLDRIIRQIKQEIIIDREALNADVWASHGGFAGIDRVFDGQLGTILDDLKNEIWSDSA